MPGGDTRTSIIVPAYREAPNLALLAKRVFAAMAASGMEAELVIVDDDSRDGTEEIVRSLQESHPIRLVVRRGERGLSGAVLRGLTEAKFDTLVVLDADLQHPPERIPDLVHRLHEDDCDFVMGTRYGGGSVSTAWPSYRRLASKTATWLAYPLAAVTDPMSGFFALRRRTLRRAERLDPIGYKIALELLVKSRCRHVAEVPIEFATRHAGSSKAGLGEMVKFLLHLGRLYRFKFPIGSRVVFALAALVAMIALALLLFGR